MKKLTSKWSLILVAVLLFSCTQEAEKSSTPDVVFETTKGNIVLRLYDETPQHRDNILKLVEDNFYDSVLFHRVIERFMIQAGDPDSKGAPADVSLGSGGLSYTVPAEFHPNLFHKRGALGAARDGNPARASSSTQFYIVQGRVYTDSLLIAQEKRINGWLAMNRVVNDSANLELIETRNRLWEEDKEDSAQLITDELNRLRDLDLETAELYVIPEPHREIYKSVGGAAHLDQNYTVYGEVIEGMDIVDQIAAVATNDANRPVEDVRIITTKLVERK